MKTVLSSVLFFICLYSWAQQPVPYQLGDPIRNFSLLNVANQESISLESYNDKKVVVLIFTSNNCPYSKLYEKRITELSKQYTASGVVFLLVNSAMTTNDKNENIDAMRTKIQASNYLFPYLADTLQTLSAEFGISRLPDAFILKKMEGSFRLVYKGAIDDNPQSAEEASSHYLSDAINAMVNNKTIKITETRPVGCLIKPY
ncbi:MAG: thioredoxin family protein [Cytophagales bacterium]|nr:thioredoxin family protein [Cytophaga sp.]